MTTYTSAPAVNLRPTAGLAVETRALRKSFGLHTVLDGVDLQVPEGSFAAVMGPSGTGKSVLVKHIIGIQKPDQGEVLVHGRALSRLSGSELTALRREIGVMFQDGALLSSLNVYDNVAFPLRQHTNLKEVQIRELVNDQLRAVGLSEAGPRYPAELSGGMKKRVGLARSLVLEPSLVLCDEPDSGLDPVRTALLGKLLVERHAELEGTMIVVTHDVSLARLICDYAAIMWSGTVVAQGPADEIWNSENPFVRQFLKAETMGPLGMD